MPTFAYTARRPGSDTIRDVIEAADRMEAATRLKRQGWFILNVEPVVAASREGGRLRRITREDIAILTSQLASLLKAGLPLASALRSLGQQMKGLPLAEVLERIEREVSESTTLSESMGRYGRLFPRTYTAAVRAGEEGGMLAEVLNRLAENLKKEMEIRGRIRGAMAYPVFLCVLGGATLVVLLTFVIPRFTKLFATMGEQLPLPTRMLLSFSDVMDRFWPMVLCGLGAAIAGVVVAARQEMVRQVVDRWVLKLPYVGPIVQRSEIARFARTLSELLNSGVPILASLQITRGVVANRCFTNALNEIRDGVAKGNPVATVLAELEVFSPLVVNMTAVGEQSGQLPELLLEVADIYEKECERAIQAFTTILGPALIVVLGGVIAFVITAILLPVFQASTLAG
jgi:type II secretory pathway component PulF